MSVSPLLKFSDKKKTIYVMQFQVERKAPEEGRWYPENVGLTSLIESTHGFQDENLTSE
jgi:hypothetical protein